MVRKSRRWVLVLAGIGVVVAPRLVAAQSAGAGAGAASANGGAAGMYANPYANPYLNPFMNPYMTQAPINGNAALYFMAAQQANGGIGSGQLSGVRGTSNRGMTVIEIPEDRRTSDVPGGSAQRYFNRKPQISTAPGQFYNRQKARSSSNRH